MKRILIISLSLMLLASGIMATDTRVMTMGDNNIIMLDEANIWLFPSRINYYPDLAEMELAQRYNYYIDRAPGDGPVPAEQSSAIERVGVNLKFGGDKPWVIGLYLHDSFGSVNMYSPIYGNPYSNKRGDFFYGRKLGELNFGFHLGYIHSSYENLSGSGSNSFNSNSYSQTTLEVGITKDDKFDIMVGLESFDFTDVQTVQLNESLGGGPYGGMDNYAPDGNSKIYFKARYFHELNTKVTAVPHIGFSKGSYKWNLYDWDADYLDPGSGGMNELDQTSDTKVTEFNLGCGMHYTPASNVLTVIDFGLETFRYERTHTNTHFSIPDSIEVTDTKSSWTALPYIKLGFEADVFKWMDVRFGATTYWKKTTDENGYFSSKSSYKYPENTNYLGFGFHWGRFHVDTYANPQIFLDGFDFIAGSNDYRDEYYDQQMNLKISAVYEMH